jgi:hypothetical protein
MPTLLTDPRSGGVKKSSGVNVLPIIAKSKSTVHQLKQTDDTNIRSMTNSSIFKCCNANIKYFIAAEPFYRIRDTVRVFLIPCFVVSAKCSNNNEMHFQLYACS